MAPRTVMETRREGLLSGARLSGQTRPACRAPWKPYQRTKPAIGMVAWGTVAAIQPHRSAILSQYD